MAGGGAALQVSRVGCSPDNSPLPAFSYDVRPAQCQHARQRRKSCQSRPLLEPRQRRRRAHAHLATASLAGTAQVDLHVCLLDFASSVYQPEADDA